MKVVHKYPIKIPKGAVDVEIELPRLAEILHVDAQHIVVQTDAGTMKFWQPAIWALVCPNNDKEKRRFRLVATGEDIDLGTQTERNRYTDTKYIGTVLMADGDLVYHLFEVWLSTVGRIESAKIEGPKP